jgi:hypothetical protein
VDVRCGPSERQSPRTETVTTDPHASCTGAQRDTPLKKLLRAEHGDADLQQFYLSFFMPSWELVRATLLPTLHTGVDPQRASTKCADLREINPRRPPRTLAGEASAAEAQLHG